MKSISTDSEKVAKILFESGCIIFRPKQPFKYNTGIISPVYTDNRLIISTTKGLLTHDEAREKNLGGKLIAFVF